MPEAIGNIALPEGWTAEELPSYKGFILISAKNGGFVTVDLKNRVFRLGFTLLGKPDSRKSHQGRGWKTALIADAVANLQAAIR